MPYRKVPLIDNHSYHIYNRGNNRKEIFFEEKNYHFLLGRIQENLTDYSEIIAYCLMPNHYHFLVKITDADNFVKGIKKTFISYSKAINISYSRSGHLFEVRYKCKIIPNNNYLLHLSRYIHLNPVRAKLVETADQWIFSSYCEFTGRKKVDFIKPGIITSQVQDYKDFVESYQEDQNYYVKDLLF